MYSKVQIFNLALGALLLNKQVTDTATDTSVECSTLNVHYDPAIATALQDMDLDATSTQADLELIEADPNQLWSYSYKYPNNCLFFRRIQSPQKKDVRSTQIARRISTKAGVKTIFTNEVEAIGEYIPDDIDVGLLSASAGLAVAYRLAYLAAPLISGKGAAKLREEIQKMYIVAKTEAQEHDRLENATFDADDVISEFVQERIS